MIDEEFKNITEYLDEKIIFHQAIKEPINKDLDISIKLSVAYEKLQQKNQELQKENEKNKHYKTLYQSLKSQKEELRDYLEHELNTSYKNSARFYFCKLILSKLEYLEGVSNE